MLPSVTTFKEMPEQPVVGLQPDGEDEFEDANPEVVAHPEGGVIPPGFDVPAAKRSASGKRGAITRLINQIEPFIQNLQVDTITNAEPANWLVRNLNKLERMRDELHVAYETLIATHAASRARYIDSQEHLEEAVNPTITNIMATLAVLPSSSNTEPPQAQVPQGDPRPRMGVIAKANIALQPTILTPDLRSKGELIQSTLDRVKKRI